MSTIAAVSSPLHLSELAISRSFVRLRWGLRQFRSAFGRPSESLCHFSALSSSLIGDYDIGCDKLFSERLGEAAVVLPPLLQPCDAWLGGRRCLAAAEGEVGTAGAVTDPACSVLGTASASSRHA